MCKSVQIFKHAKSDYSGMPEGTENRTCICTLLVGISEAVCDAPRRTKIQIYCTAPQTALLEIFIFFKLFVNVEVLINRNILLYSFSEIRSNNINVYKLVESLCNK